MDIIAQERALDDMAYWKKQVDGIRQLCDEANMPTVKGNDTMDLTARVAWGFALLAAYRATPLKAYVEGVK